MDVSLTGIGCPTVPVKGYMQTTGSLVIEANGNYTDNTTTKGIVRFPLEAPCLSVSSIATECDRIAAIFSPLGWKGTCTETAGECNCELTANQKAGLGSILPYTEPTGTATFAGNKLTASNATYTYCASGDELTLTPEMSSLTGTVVLKRDGSTGSTDGTTSSTAGTSTGTTSTTSTASSSADTGASTTVTSTGTESSSTMEVSTTSGETSSGPDTGVIVGDVTGPCDIYSMGGNECVAAHSTIRALFGTYDGNLYQVKRASDGMTTDIAVMAPGGMANSALQDTFCQGTSCTITIVYDQSGNGNFLEAETPDSSVGGFNGQTAANAAAESLTVNGHKVYSLFTRPRQAYWRDGSQSGMPLGAEPQGIYMVTSGKHFNDGCCYDYGNGETNRKYVPGPSMDAVYFGDNRIWGTGAGDEGPWIMADMEDGMVNGAQGSQKGNPNIPAMPYDYVTAMHKNNGTTEFALKGADATTPTLQTFYQGQLPPGKNPMEKQGSIVLGSGGDCCLSNNNASEGTFYEGAIVAGYPSDDTDQAVHANVVEIGYGK
jgi:hypothetical protein